jgi:hypothetical protein
MPNSYAIEYYRGKYEKLGEYVLHGFPFHRCFSAVYRKFAQLPQKLVNSIKIKVRFVL